MAMAEVEAVAIEGKEFEDSFGRNQICI